MVNINKLRATLLLIKGSLFPVKRSDSRFSPPENGVRINIAPEQFSAAFSDMNSLLRPDGSLELHFADALFPAAPFLLARFKSCGFSGCKAIMSPQGILLTGRR